MIGFSKGQRYFLYRPATDMRKSFNGLGGLVRGEMGGDLMSGDVFIFLNRRRNRIKLLVWDQSGFAIWYKCLEEGTFELPGNGRRGLEIELKWEELVLILEGIKLESVRRRKRYAHGRRNAQNVDKKTVLEF